MKGSTSGAPAPANEASSAPRLDWSGYFRERYAKARLTEGPAAAIRWFAAAQGGPAKILVIAAEDWPSDCRRDVPHLARLAEAGGLEMRIFTRAGEKMHLKGLPHPWLSDDADDLAPALLHVS